MYKLITDNPCQRNIEIAQAREYDMVQTTRPFRCTGEFLIIPEGDFEGLTQAEIDGLEEYTPPTAEDI